MTVSSEEVRSFLESNAIEHWSTETYLRVDHEEGYWNEYDEFEYNYHMLEVTAFFIPAHTDKQFDRVKSKLKWFEQYSNLEYKLERIRGKYQIIIYCK